MIGNVSARAYINNSGEAAASLDMTARSVQFLSGGRDGGDFQSGGGQRGGRREAYRGDDRASNYAEPPSTIDDIPF